MYKSTADSRQFQRREGSHATKGSARGTNLLGWEMPENLSPEQQRRAMAARVTQIHSQFREDKAMPKWKREELVAECGRLERLMRKIRPTRRSEGVQQHFIDVARERLTAAEFSVWMGEAAERLRRSEANPTSGVAPTHEPQCECMDCALAAGVAEVRHQTEAPADADDAGIGHE